VSASRPLSFASRISRFFAAHPIAALAVLTPGIPEYLSSSSPLLNLAVNPAWFFLQLAINVGQYTAGALLIREAILRWGKGWGSVALLAGAYGITEEALGDNTLLNSNHGADGVLGSYGRFGGVNWVWSTGVLAFHVVYSIGLPILLLGLAVPSTRGRSLLGRRGILVAFLSLVATTFLESEIVLSSYHFWMGVPLFLGCLAAIAALTYAAYRVPRTLVAPRSETCTLGSGTALLVGFSMFPIAFGFEYGVGALGVPALAVILLELLAFLGLFEVVRRGIGRRGNERALVDLAYGFILWQAAFGVLLTLGLPYTLPLVAIAVLFFTRLRRAYPRGSASPPAGAMGPGGAPVLPPAP